MNVSLGAELAMSSTSSSNRGDESQVVMEYVQYSEGERGEEALCICCGVRVRLCICTSICPA